jgi:cardiolipin synthase
VRALAAPWWLWLLAIVGMIAVVGFLAFLFSIFHPRPDKIVLTETAPVGSRAFLDAVSAVANAPLGNGGRATLLSDGDEIYPALLEAIGAALVSVNVMAYIWRPGEVSARILDALVERARAGVEVRVLIDGFGGRKMPLSEWRRLEEAGGRCAWFRPLRVGTLARYHRRSHRRAIVVDGFVGFTGGAAFADVWLGRAQDPDHWRDSMVRVTGPPARALQAAFVQLWANTSGEILVGKRFYSTRDAGDEGGEPIRHYVGVTSSPGGEDHPLRLIFVLSFLAARHRLFVTTSYFVPDSAMLRALEDRAAAGVDVRLLLPGSHTDARSVRWAGQRHFQRLLEGGVRIFEYRPTMLHVKTVVVDGVWSIVGSANLDLRSWELDEENVLGIHDAEFGASLEERFLADLGFADEVRLEDWRSRGVLARSREGLFALLARQF